MSINKLKEMKQRISELTSSNDPSTLHTLADYCVSSALELINKQCIKPVHAWVHSFSALFSHQSIQISDVNFDGKSQEGEKSEENEYIEIDNKGPFIINLEGWHINAGPKQDFIFQKAFIEPNQKIRIYTFDKSKFSFKSTQPIWNNRGDEASLEDAEGNLISRWVYGREVEPHILISNLAYDGKEKMSEGDEYVELTNSSQYWLDISHWILGGGHADDFIFPEGSCIAPGALVRVYTNKIDQETGGFSWNSKRAIWNNNGGRAHLTGFENRLAAEYSY